MRDGIRRFLDDLRASIAKREEQRRKDELFHQRMAALADRYHDYGAMPPTVVDIENAWFNGFTAARLTRPTVQQQKAQSATWSDIADLCPRVVEEET